MALQGPATTLNTINTLVRDVVTQIDSLAASVSSYKSLSEALSAESIQSVDDALSSALSYVRVLRNFRSPVNSLPPEILTIIFKCLTEPNAHGETPKPQNTSPADWIYITHVCKYWRDSALAYPFMWSPVVFEPRDLASPSSLPYLCLERSLGAPLDVQIRCEKDMDVRIWSELAGRSSRLRKLHVIDLLDANHLERLCEPAPLLQTLHIEVSPDLLDRRWEGEEVPDELPELFAGSTPALRHLKFALFTSFSNNRFQNLATLHLSHQLYRTPGDLTRLFSLLEASLHMEELALTDCDLDGTHEGPAPTDGRFLPMYRLRRAAFVGCHATLVGSVLARLEVAHDGLALVCRDWTPGARPLSAVFPARGTSRLHALDAVSALALDYDRATVTAAGAHTAVRLGFENDMDVADGVVPALGALFPLHAVRTLALAGIELRAAPFWRAFLAGFPALTALTLWLPPTGTAKWIDALRAGPPGAAYPAPLLDTLTLFPPHADIWDTVADVVCSRARDGHPIRVLRVLMEAGTRDAAIRGAFEDLDVASLEPYVESVVREVVSCYPSDISVPEEHRTFIMQ